jgi:predicted transcriptional regulator
MEVHFTPEQEAQFSQVASHAGTDTERLVEDAALRLLEQDARFRAAVREGIAQADREEFIEEEEMDVGCPAPCCFLARGGGLRVGDRSDTLRR